MCGIFGQFKTMRFWKYHERLAHRGQDGMSIVVDGQRCVGGAAPMRDWAMVHYLHAMVGNVAQPLESDGHWFCANCEIYNWEALRDQYGIVCANDAELLFGLLRSYGIKALAMLDGVYAFAWLHDGAVTLARDLFGVKPLFFHHDGESFSWASENKALDGKGEALNPRTVLTFSKGTMTLISRPWSFSCHIDTEIQASKRIGDLLLGAVRKRISYAGAIGVLFSGGVDSLLIAHLLKLMGKEVHLYVGAKEGSHDAIAAKEGAAFLELPITFADVPADQAALGKMLCDVASLIESDNYVRVSVAVPLYLALRAAKRDGIRLVFSGVGSEDVFAGYRRYADADDINAACREGLKEISERDLYRDDVLSMSCGIELRLPFLDRYLVGYGIGTNSSLKVRDGVKKYILRKAALHLGLPESFAMRPRKAAQYGSGYERDLARLAASLDVQKRDLVSTLISLRAR